MTETQPEYTLPTRSTHQESALSEENSLITKLLSAKDETGNRKVKKSKLTRYYESKFSK
jgi:hypothetical protein